MLLSHARSFVCLGALASSAPAFAHDTWIVDADGGADFTEIQAGVDVAASGDTILVRSPIGSEARYAGFVIEGKSLTVVGADDGPVPTGPVLVRGLPEDGLVILSRLDVRWNAFEHWGLPQQGTPGPGLHVEDALGRVRVQDSRIAGWRTGGALPVDVGFAALRVERCADVALRACDLQGGWGSGATGGVGAPGGAGIEALRSRLVLQACTAEGGSGWSVSSTDTGGEGGPGLIAVASRVHVSGGRMAGGRGGFAIHGGTGGAGGDGVVFAPNAQGIGVGVEAVAGEGGLGTTSDGAPGAATSGNWHAFAAPSSSLSVARLGAEGSTVRARISGVPGERAYLLVSAGTRSRRLSPRAGVLLVAEPLPNGRLDLGPVPASGVLEVDLSLDDVPDAEVGARFLQSAFVAPNGSLQLGELAFLGIVGRDARPACGGRLYVDAAALPGGDGLSWPGAYRDLAQALIAAPGCPGAPTEIWVAQGTYRPDGGTLDRTRSFAVRPGTHVYGGFAGGETQLSERDPASHPVVLTGDLFGDDLPGFGQRDDNAFNVVRAGTRIVPVDDVRLDGLTVSGGVAAAGPGDGAGVYASGDVAVVGCTLEDNHAGTGGGLFSFTGELRAVHSRFIGNSAGVGAGMAVAGFGSSPSALVHGCAFLGNEATVMGGGINAEAPLAVTSSVFHANRGGLLGGGAVLATTDVVSSATSCIASDNGSHFAQLLVGQVDYTCDDSYDPSAGGAGNLALDPGFVDPLGPDGIAGTADDDLRLAAGSPCVDAGSNDAVPLDVFDLDGDGDAGEPTPLDLSGDPRFVDDPAAPDVGQGTAPIVDMGPYERQP